MKYFLRHFSPATLKMDGWRAKLILSEEGICQSKEIEKKQQIHINIVMSVIIFFSSSLLL
jgi:hypothetical protein